jgi:hypothetical protein
MRPYQQRVVDEKQELDGRIEKLMAFLSSGLFSMLGEGEQSRLRIQLHAMQTYGAVLGERIVHFESME